MSYVKVGSTAAREIGAYLHAPSHECPKGYWCWMIARPLPVGGGNQNTAKKHKHTKWAARYEAKNARRAQGKRR